MVVQALGAGHEGSASKHKGLRCLTNIYIDIESAASRYGFQGSAQPEARFVDQCHKVNIRPLKTGCDDAGANIPPDAPLLV